MTWLRHAGRHVKATAMANVRSHLEVLGWTSEANLPFGTAHSDVVTFDDTPVILGDEVNDAIRSGMIVVSLGDEYESDMLEMGGPLASQEYPIFFDIFQKSPSAALALAEDVRDILKGRLPDTATWTPLINQVSEAEVAGWRVEYDDVERVEPRQRPPHHWQVVKVTCTAYFPEVRY